MKNSPRSLLSLVGVEDGSFYAFSRIKKSKAYLCSVVMALPDIKSVSLSRVEVDGLDATEKLLTMLEGVNAESIILGGITFAGFNIINPFKIHGETGIPVVVYSGKKPDSESMLRSLTKHFSDWEARWEIIEKLGAVHTTFTKPDEPPAYFEVVGEQPSWAEKILKNSALLCRIPEPVRVARLIARGISPASC